MIIIDGEEINIKYVDMDSLKEDNMT